MPVLKGHKQPVQWVAFAADGASLLSVDRSDGVRVWDAPSGRPRWADDEHCYASVALTADGRQVFTYDRDGTAPTDINGHPRLAFDREHPAQLRDIRTGVPAAVPVVADWLADLAFCPDGGRCVARLGTDSRDLHWWAYPSWEPLPVWADVVPHALARFKAVAFSPDGRTLAGMNSAGVTVFDVPAGGRRRVHPFPVVQDECRLAFHPDGRHLAVGSGTRLAVLDVETGAEVGAIRQARKFFLGAAFTPDGRFLATASNEATVKFWDATTWRLVTEFAWQAGGLRCLAFSPDGLTAAAGGTGNTVVLWDVDL